MDIERLSSNEIKIKNRQRIYQYIRMNGSASKQDLVVALQLSLPTVTQNLEYLKQTALIDASKKITNTGGRNATAFSYLKKAKMAIGVYISSHHMNAVAVNLSGEVEALVKEQITFNLEDDAYLRKLGTVVEKVKKQAGIREEDLLGVGIAVPGLVSDDGTCVTYGLTLDFTGKTRDEIGKYIPYSCRLVHDSYAAGYIETWKNQSIRNAFYISLSNSVGGSIIIDHEIYEGDTQKGGEIGHMIVVPEGGEKCYCGKYGCFDTVCKAGNLDWYTNGNLEQYFDRLREKDHTAVKLWEEYLDHLALAIHNIRILFDGKIILGGYVGAYIGEYMDELCQRVDDKNPFGDCARDYLYPCHYKKEASAAGAAIFFIDEFLADI
nr:ROK family protein [uncultured Merdimonas sp.]